MILSYLLYASNIPLIRLLEGYVFRDSWLFRLIGHIEERRYQKLSVDITKCDEIIKKTLQLESELELYGLSTPELKHRLQTIRHNWTNLQAPLMELMHLRFPYPGQRLLPTAFGNTIAAFEYYPWARYRMDAVHLWPRLLPILEQKKFTPFVQNEKAILDFLINSGLASVLISLELSIIGLLSGLDWHYFVASGLLLDFAYVLYHFAVTAAKHWGGLVRVAFDLYREDLRKALYLPPIQDESLKEERILWQTISQFIVYGEDRHFKGFFYSNSQANNEQTEENAS